MTSGEHPHAAIVRLLCPGGRLRASVPLTGGVSADVSRLDVTSAAGEDASFVLRVHGATHGGHPAPLEHQLLRTLHERGVPVPEPLLVDVSGRLLRDPFLVMRFVEGAADIPPEDAASRIEAMANLLAKIHELPTAELPELPARTDPLSSVLDYLPDGKEWADLRAHLEEQTETAYARPPKLLHGDFWPGNVLWNDGAITAVLDWEDSALGDPLSDVACARVELRYAFGRPGMDAFTRAYARHRALDPRRLALWQVYVAAAAQHFMGKWRLDPALEAHMRAEALASIREAGGMLLGQRAP